MTRSISMNWQQLLNKTRLGNRPAKDESGRNAFLRDHDKIIFSGAFRRLARKTQVHPLASNDHIHNRLTHSLEVSCVGRTLGIRVGEALRGHGLLPDQIDATDLGDIVQSACLAHDIGNPPFGHTGERAIRSWFLERGQKYLAGLNASQRADLESFEGNAQGFRILTKSEYHQYNDGMRLTYATLATFLKYPWLAETAKSGITPRREKFSAFGAEKSALIEVCNATGLRQRATDFENQIFYSRHPLAFLVEAADDFCYAIIDLEDGLEMNLLHWSDVFPLLQPILPHNREIIDLVQSDFRPGRKAALLRGSIIEHFIDAGVNAFMHHHDELLAGNIDSDLISLCAAPVRDAVEGSKQLAKTRVFEHPLKIELEIGAYQVIGTLLDSLIEAAIAKAENDLSNFRHQRLINLMGEHTFPPNLEQLDTMEKRYQCIMRAVDFIAGMTDNYATYLAKQFNGWAEVRY
ncbi:MAG: deoxyguanosinetriphosphate triphosphohydrolase [Spongiibacteraceae bacterium]